MCHLGNHVLIQNRDYSVGICEDHGILMAEVKRPWRAVEDNAFKDLMRVAFDLYPRKNIVLDRSKLHGRVWP